jgi:hypothetical protein
VRESETEIKQSKVTMTSASTSLVLVGWDDIKGRPIYSRKPASSSSSSSSAPAKKNKAPTKKGIATAAPERNNFKTKSRQRSNNVNVNGRRNIPTVQVAVGSLMASSIADEASLNHQSSHAASNGQISKPARREVSFSPTTFSKPRKDTNCRHSNSSKLSLLPSTKSWDKKRKGYGSKKFSRGSNTGYISPVIVLGDAENVGVGWGGDGTSASARYDYDTNSMESEQLDNRENEKDEVFSLVDDDLSSRESNNDGVDLAAATAAAARDIQSVGHDSNHFSLDKHHSGSELKGSNTSFSYDQLDNHDDVVHFHCINQPKNGYIPEIIHVENANDDDDDDELTAKADESSETSYTLHSGGTNDFVDYDIHLDEPNATDNANQRRRGKKRSYGCFEKPVWVAPNRQAKAAAADNVIGWDEEKCRPIFAKLKKKLDEIRLDESSNDDIDVEDVGDNANKKSHKRRAYSSRFRKTSLTKAIEQMSVLTSPKDDDDHADIESTQEESHGDYVNLVNANDEETERRAESNVNLDLESARHIQPTESSSLEAARAFYRYLDSNHRLVVVGQYDSSPRVSSEVVRSTRRIVHSHQLRTDYADYCDVLAETGVAPITITEFASNWNRYFVCKGIRDGLLDED